MKQNKHHESMFAVAQCLLHPLKTSLKLELKLIPAESTSYWPVLPLFLIEEVFFVKNASLNFYRKINSLFPKVISCTCKFHMNYWPCHPSLLWYAKVVVPGHKMTSLWLCYYTKNQDQILGNSWKALCKYPYWHFYHLKWLIRWSHSDPDLFHLPILVLL